MKILSQIRDGFRRRHELRVCRDIAKNGSVRPTNLGWRNAPCADRWAHAGGGRLHIYGNSQEAFDDAIDSGFSIIEADVMMTSDHVPVMSHRFRPNNEVAFDLIPTASEFLSQKVNGKYTPLTLDAFIVRYAATPVYVSLDPSPSFRRQFGADYLLDYVKRFENADFERRVIYQLSGVDDLARFVSVDWKGAFHYNLDFDVSSAENRWRVEALVPALKALGIGSVSYVDMPVTEALAEAVSRFVSAGIAVSVASVNSEERFRRLRQLGISCIDTDYLYPQSNARHD